MSLKQGAIFQGNMSLIFLKFSLCRVRCSKKHQNEKIPFPQYGKVEFGPDQHFLLKRQLSKMATRGPTNRLKITGEVKK